MDHRPHIYRLWPASQRRDYHVRLVVIAGNNGLIDPVHHQLCSVFESTPVYPTPSRYWETVAKHKLTQFYSAPTAIRLLRRLGPEHVQNHDLSSLRILGSVGEPINPEAWHWYNEHVGKKECAVVDTFWQTETGSIVVTPFPGAIPTKPGSATVPFFGIEPCILEPEKGTLLEGNGVEGVLAFRTPWPSIARTVWKDHKRYLETYMKVRNTFLLAEVYRLTSDCSHTLDTTLLVTVLPAMPMATSGSEDVSMMLLTCLDIVSPLLKSRVHSSCILVSLRLLVRHFYQTL